MVKKFAISFVWHMHQPCYKDGQTGQYLMPWVRLHAVKDYLDMLLLTTEFPNIKQTFNLVPLLLDQIEDYANNNAHDLHSKYTVSDVDTFSREDKEFVLSNFFAANYEHQIQPNPRYLELYNKYFEEQKTVDDFSTQEFSDLMALFNLAWFDPYHRENNPEIEYLYNKQNNYTLDDRIRIIELQREIMRKIIPAYKEQLEKGKIEISTSHYYHSLIPLMVNFDKTKSVNKHITLPEIPCALKSFAQKQIEKSISKFEELFGQKPNGMWLPELCINNDALKMLLNYDFKWTIADESILSKTLKKDMTRNYRGLLEDPFDLCVPHAYLHNNKEINIVFRNALLSNLISFEYANYNALQAANDLYERIKVAQDKLSLSPIEEHGAIIAIDGENCWENYPNDGLEFLRALYTLLNNDETLEVITVSEYLSKVKIKQLLNSVQSGSWINANFDMWIGDPTKNIAWDYLSKTKEDFAVAIKNSNYDKEIIEKAEKELLIAQGSDWFWWYGEPNNSGQDEVFDYLFREHLKNVYSLLNIYKPEYLNMPLEIFIGKPSKHPKSLITPKISGEERNHDDWTNAGCIEVPQSPTMMTKMIDKICFGNDYNNIYLMFNLNKYYMEKNNNTTYPNELFVYFAKRKAEHYSSIRLRNKNESVPQILKYVYTHEIQ
ncbi:MAG: glycoside hydrolase family 57 protein, partial [Candidatus Gastranaerophilales bacterium]|nr:glycoside hydrolase family 57 protein [Candidatus Gastranaerophilales bacterium]